MSLIRDPERTREISRHEGELARAYHRGFEDGKRAGLKAARKAIAAQIRKLPGEPRVNL